MSSSSGDLKSHAASNEDFYALLSVSPAAAEPEIRRAYRRTALKYHPDKIANPTTADIDKFHLLQIAYDVLSDPSVRQLYDNAREARERRKREREMMDVAKRRMREDLEARERAGASKIQHKGTKRSWMPDDDGEAEEKLQREIERIAEDGRRRRRQAEENLRREVEEEERLAREEEEKRQAAADRSNQRVDRTQVGGGTSVAELERAIKVRWVREGRGLELSIDRLIALFTPFGAIENAFTLKDKRQRVGEKREKKTVATGVVIFTSIIGAHAAVLDSERMKSRHVSQTDSDWAVIDSVFWASGSQPDIGIGSDKPAVFSSDSTPLDIPSVRPTKLPFSFPGLKASDESNLKPGKAPSFGSFTAAAATSPRNALPGEPTKGLNAPSLEEITIMRLKSAQREKERRALEEQLVKEDEAADATEATKG